MNAAAVALAGETVWLSPLRALFWPRAGLLMIADLHLGKGHAFRRSGQALPPGGTRTDLTRLDALLQRFTPRSLLILGDLLHGALERDSPWLQQWRDWRNAHAALELQVVAGNHDRALDAELLQVDAVMDQLTLPPFAMVHDTDAEPSHGLDPELHRIGGHLHPVVRLRDTGLSARLPAFWLGPRRTVLPAFTAFSGGVDLRTGPEDRIWACVEHRVLSLPAAAYRD